MITLDKRQQKALAFHKQGYNCAQCVLLAFNDITGLADSDAARMAMGLGGGFGTQGELCGVLLGMALTLGTQRGDDPAVKPKVNAEVKELTRRFRERTAGNIHCRDLKSMTPPRACDTLIADGVDILQNYLDEKR